MLSARNRNAIRGSESRRGAVVELFLVNDVFPLTDPLIAAAQQARGRRWHDGASCDMYAEGASIHEISIWEACRKKDFV